MVGLEDVRSLERTSEMRQLVVARAISGMRFSSLGRRGARSFEGTTEIEQRMIARAISGLLLSSGGDTIAISAIAD